MTVFGANRIAHDIGESAPSQPLQVHVQPQADADAQQATSKEMELVSSSATPLCEEVLASKSQAKASFDLNTLTAESSLKQLFKTKKHKKSTKLHETYMELQDTPKFSVYNFGAHFKMLFTLMIPAVASLLVSAVVIYVYDKECAYALMPDQWQCFADVEPNAYFIQRHEFMACVDDTKNWSWGTHTVLISIHLASTLVKDIFFFTIIWFGFSYGFHHFTKKEKFLLFGNAGLACAILVVWLVLLGQSERLNLTWVIFMAPFLFVLFYQVFSKARSIMPYSPVAWSMMTIYLVYLVIGLLVYRGLIYMFMSGRYATGSGRLFFRLVVHPFWWGAIELFVQYRVSQFKEPRNGMEPLLQYPAAFFKALYGRFLIVQIDSAGDTAMVCMMLALAQLGSSVMLRDEKLIILRFFFGTRLSEAILATRRSIDAWLSYRWMSMACEYMSIFSIGLNTILMKINFSPDEHVAPDAWLIVKVTMFQFVIQVCLDLATIVTDRVFHGYDHQIAWHVKSRMFMVSLVLFAVTIPNLLQQVLSYSLCPQYYEGEGILYEYCQAGQAGSAPKELYIGYRRPDPCAQGDATPLFDFPESKIVLMEL